MGTMLKPSKVYSMWPTKLFEGLAIDVGPYLKNQNSGKNIFLVLWGFQVRRQWEFISDKSGENGRIQIEPINKKLK